MFTLPVCPEQAVRVVAGVVMLGDGLTVKVEVSEVEAAQDPFLGVAEMVTNPELVKFTVAVGPEGAGPDSVPPAVTDQV